MPLIVLFPGMTHSMSSVNTFMIDSRSPAANASHAACVTALFPAASFCDVDIACSSLVEGTTSRVGISRRGVPSWGG